MLPSALKLPCIYRLFNFFSHIASPVSVVESNRRIQSQNTVKMKFEIVLVSFCYLLAIFHVSHGDVLESICGKTDMSVIDKSFSFSWTIAGMGERLSDASVFKTSADNITFKQSGSEHWTFNLQKYGKSQVFLSAFPSQPQLSTHVYVDQNRNPHTIYYITPELSAKDQVTTLDTIVVSNDAYSNHFNHFNYFNNFHGIQNWNNWGKGVANKVQHPPQPVGQNPSPPQAQTQTMESRPDSPTYHDATLKRGVQNPGVHGGLKKLWNRGKGNIFAQLNKTLADAGGDVQEFKIKFLIKASISKNEYTNTGCN